MDERIICSGFSGQGVISMGQLIAYAGMSEDREVSWVPSYGPEMRGGTANCSVMVSDTPIGSPLVDNNATSLIAMNLPSLEKFEPQLESGGRLFLNSSLVNKKASRSDIAVFYIPAGDLADKLGNSRVANMIMLGAYLEQASAISIDSVKPYLRKVFPRAKERTLALNERALDMGADYIRSQSH